MADAVLARDEDHRGRRNARDVNGVVARARGDVHVAVTELLRRAADDAHAAGVERTRRVVGDLLHVEGQPTLAPRAIDECAKLAVHAIERFGAGIAQVDREAHFSRNHVAAVGKHADIADGAASVRRVAVAERDDLLHDARRNSQRITTRRHRRRSGMRLRPRHRTVVPAQAQSAVDDADHGRRIFQYRALFDMRFEVAREGMTSGCFVPEITDPLELVAHRSAADVARGVRVVEPECAAEHARAHHHGNEARPFLVGPDRDLHRGVRFDRMIVQCAHHLQRGEHAVVAVELAAGGLRVDVRTRHYRGTAGVPTGAAHEDVADPVDADRHVHRRGVRDHPVARLAVQIGQRQAGDAAFGRGADPRQFHQRPPETVAVDARLGLDHGSFTSCVRRPDAFLRKPAL